MPRTWMIGLALLAGCSKSGPACGDLKQTATHDVNAAREALLAFDQNHGKMEQANIDVRDLAAFDKKLTDAIAELAPYGCAPALVCCAKAQSWIDERAKATAGAGPSWRLPELGTSKGQPDALTSDLTTYDHGVDRLDAELTKGKAAKLAVVTEACTQANDAITRIKTAMPDVLSKAHAKVDGQLAALKAAYAAREHNLNVLLAWEDAITSGAAVDLGTPAPDEPKELTAARATMARVASCGK